MKEKKYYGIFETSFGLPAMTKKKHTIKELEDIWKKSKVDITIDEIGINLNYYSLGGFTYVENKKIAKEIFDEETLKFLKEKGGLS